MDWKEAQAEIENKRKADKEAEATKPLEPLVLKDGGHCAITLVEGEKPTFEKDRNGDLILKSLKVQALFTEGGDKYVLLPRTIELGPSATAKFVKDVNAGYKNFIVSSKDGKVHVETNPAVDILNLLREKIFSWGEDDWTHTRRRYRRPHGFETLPLWGSWFFGSK